MELITNEIFTVGYEIDDNGAILFDTKNVVMSLWEPEIKGGKQYPQWAKAQRAIDKFNLSAESQKIKDMHLISEEITYALIMNSDSPKALKFQLWIATDVLPSIRRYGCYISADADKEVVADVVNAKTIARQIKSMFNDGMGVSITKILKTVSENRPKGKGSSDLQKVFTDNALKGLSDVMNSEHASDGVKSDIIKFMYELKMESMAIHNRTMGRRVQVLSDKVQKLEPNYQYEIKIKPFSENQRNKIVILPDGTQKYVNTQDFLDFKEICFEKFDEINLRDLYNSETSVDVLVRLKYEDKSDVDNFIKPFQDVLCEYLEIDDSVLNNCTYNKEQAIYKNGYRFGFR